MKYDYEATFEGYKVLFYTKDFTTPVQLVLTNEQYKDKKQLLNWIDFLIKTEQWVPYNLYKDIFEIAEESYNDLGLEYVKDMTVEYEYYLRKTKKINLDLE